MSADPVSGATPHGGGSALGTNTVIVRRSAPSSALEQRVIRRESRIERYRLQASARRILPKERIRACLLVPAPLSSPHLKYSPRHKSAHLGGLIRCASPWICPPCAALIAERRRAEVSAAIAWGKRQGLQVVLTTFTLRHGPTDSLAVSAKACTAAYRRMHRRRDFVALRVAHGLKHTIKALESTWSSTNGWHPHLHLLQFLNPGIDVTAYQTALATAWVASLRAEGFSATTAHGVDVKATWGDVEKYVTKLGRTWDAADELTKANTKRGRKGSYTPWDLLRSAADDGDQLHASRFREYGEAMKGKHQIQWTRGFKALVGIADRSDDDVVYDWEADDPAAYIWATFTPWDWAAIRYCGPEAKADLEAAGDRLDRERVAALLDEYRTRYFAEGWGL